MNPGSTPQDARYRYNTDNYEQYHYQAQLTQRLSEGLILNLTAHYTKGYGFTDEYRTGRKLKEYGLDNPSFNHDEAVYRQKEVYTPYIDGKYQGPVFAQGQFNEKVNNPQGLQGSYFKYLTNAAIDDVQTPYLQKKERATTMGSTGGHRLYKKPANEDEVWPIPKHLKAGAWSPVIAVSYDLTDNSRLFARFAQATRFPSIYEATSTNVNLLEAYNTEFNLKPERSTNWEAGYSFNFAPYWQRLKHGNIRLTYYSNTIKNAIDITENKNLTQYDKKQTSGIELQSRLCRVKRKNFSGSRS